MDPLYADLLRERFGTSTWFRTIPPQVEDPQMQALRQLMLNEAVEDDEEVWPDGLVQDGRLVPESPEGAGDSAP